MRAVSFVDKLEFSVSGNVCMKGIILGDVDNDNDSELVVGCLNGDLFIFKGVNTVAWKHASGLGMIVVVLVADVCNNGTNYLLVVSGDGSLHLFNVGTSSEGKDVKKTEGKGERCEKKEEPTTSSIQPCYMQKLPANVHCVLVADIDGDGLKELVVAMTDRVVRSYKWQNIAPDGDAAAASSINAEHPSGLFVAQNKWEMYSQIGTISTNVDDCGREYLLVSQPGGTYVSLKCKHWEDVFHKKDVLEAADSYSPARARDVETDSDAESWAEQSTTESQCGLESDFTLEFHPLGSSRARNSGITTEIVGNIHHKNENGIMPTATRYAIALLDGTLALLEEDKIQWSLMVDHQLIGLTKMDMTGDGNEEVVVCSWDGQTYIVDYDRRVLRFQFGKNVCAFIAGNFSVSPQTGAPCLVFCTFDNKIHVYYNVLVPQIHCSNFIEVMEKEEGIRDLLAALQVDGSSLTELKQLYKWCLYGQHPTTR